MNLVIVFLILKYIGLSPSHRHLIVSPAISLLLIRKYSSAVDHCTACLFIVLYKSDQGFRSIPVLSP
jgi:hypothetical protein